MRENCRGKNVVFRGQVIFVFVAEGQYIFATFIHINRKYHIPMYF